MSDPEVWRWIWLVAAVVFALGEIAAAGTFFLAPFALGSGVAAILAFAGVDLGVQWIAFVGVSVVSLAAMRPLAKRLDATDQPVGVGAGRQVGQRARVVERIDGGHEGGFVMLGPERWRAESATGDPIDVGTTVTVTEVKGTRVIVVPADQASPQAGAAPDPSSD